MTETLVAEVDNHSVAKRGPARPDIDGVDGRSKTVLTEIGPVAIDVPRDRDGSFEPHIEPITCGRMAAVSRREGRCNAGIELFADGGANEI